MGKAKLVKGPTGKAIDLNKQDQWVQVYRADAVEISGDKLTLTLDVLPRKYNVSGGYLLTKGENQFGLRQWRNERLDFYLDNGQKQVLSAPLPADWEGRWHNVTATYDGKEMRIYLDGALAASQPMTGAIRNLPLYWILTISLTFTMATATEQAAPLTLTVHSATQRNPWRGWCC